MNEDNWWFICPICKVQTINIISESGKIGACGSCRDSLTPKYIPEEQRDQYMKLYLKEKL